MKKSIIVIMVAFACFTVWSCDKDESMDSNKSENIDVEVVSTDTRTPIEEYAGGLRMVLEKYGNGAASRSAASDSMMVQEIQRLVSDYINRYGKSSITSDIVRAGMCTLSEDSIYILAEDKIAFQKWMSKTFSPAFVSSYSSITNGVYNSSLANEHNLNGMTPGERLIIVTALEIDQYEITNGREIVSAESACNQARKNARNLCLLLLANDAAISLAMSWNGTGEVGIILGFTSYAMCIITAENNYQACLNRAHGN